MLVCIPVPCKAVSKWVFGSLLLFSRLFKRGRSDDGNNHTVCIFPDVRHEKSFVQSDVFMLRMPLSASCTHTHTKDSTDPGIMTDTQGLHRKAQFPIWQLWLHIHTQETHTHTHTYWMEKSTKIAHCASGRVLKYVAAVTVYVQLLMDYFRRQWDDFRRFKSRTFVACAIRRWLSGFWSYSKKELRAEYTTT